MTVTKDMVYAVRMARWAEWEKMAAELPGAHHILSVEMLRTHRNETAIVLTVVHNGKLVQYELRGDARGGNPRPVISQRYLQPDCDDEVRGELGIKLDALTAINMFGPDAGGGGDGGPVAEGAGTGEPPPKEPPQPGAVALGGTLLSATFNLGEQAVGADDSQPPK